MDIQLELQRAELSRQEGAVAIGELLQYLAARNWLAVDEARFRAVTALENQLDRLIAANMELARTEQRHRRG